MDDDDDDTVVDVVSCGCWALLLSVSALGLVSVMFYNDLCFMVPAFVRLYDCMIV